jgi:hypothetical protein
MKLAFAAANTLVAFQSLIICSEIYELNKHIRPILQNQHPIFVRHGNVSLPDKNFHAEELSSVLVYDFQKLQIEYANVTHLTQNTRVAHYSIFMWTRFPSFIHIFPHNTNEEVYDLQYKFLRNSGLGLMTRPKINSVIITLEHSTVHHKNDADTFRVLRKKELVEKLVDYYDFALHFKLEDTKSLDFELFEISSVSVWKFCTDCSAAFEVSLFHFESCEKSPLNIQNNFDCVSNILQIASDSEPGLNLSRFGIEFKAYDLDFTQTYGNCLSQSIFKNYIALPFSNNFKNVSVQNVLLEELIRGLPASFNCAWKDNRNLIVINLRFFPLRIDEENHWRNKYDFQASSSLQNHGAFNFLTITNQPAEHKSTGACDQFHIDSSSCQAFRRKTFEFVNSYTYAVRSDVDKLKKKLSVCTNTAFIDTETSIDNFLHIWNQDERFPSMVKGNPFYQQSYSWTMGYSWLLRKVMSSRMKAFTTSGIIGFWERFCLKYCKIQSETSDFHNTTKNCNAVTVKPQKLALDMTSLFLIMLIISAVSILCFVGEYLFSCA